MNSAANYRKELSALNNVLAVFREMDTDGKMPVQTVQTFLLVALKPGCTQQYLTEQTGLSQSSVSRNLQALSEWQRIGKEGLNLIDAVPNPEDTRQKLIFLTPKGKQVAGKALGTLIGQPVTDFTSPTSRDHVRGVRRAFG